MTAQPFNTRHYRRFRNLLIDLNRDLLSISHKMCESDKYGGFTELEHYVMALEDRRFVSHCGFDIKASARELIKKIRRKKHGGASTIDMQMVRTITEFKDMTIYRKLYETLLSWLVNFHFTKKQIIRCYLKNAFFGSRLIGAEKAANVLFNKDLSMLEKDESAFIAAMLLRPKPLNPKNEWFEIVKSRASYAQSVRVLVEEGSK
ncbi:biosynthetic peptidoglycan transglycosylase [Aeromonas molluscorum]|uniref:biosynthetic peptidoglycan transglycosylase n=1 Tax=Aeromonas molluscorum TaxID=271417 RepID=UPI003F1CD78C